jgi:ankyrin repeat protein
MQILGGNQRILHYSCERKDTYAIKRLLDTGANVNLPDGFGFTPIMRILIGKAVNGSDVLKLLPKSKSSMRSQSSSTLSTEGSQTLTKCKERELCVSCTELLISFGASLEVQDAFGRSALHIACIFGHSALLHLLAPNGDFHHMLTKDSSGCTPLYYLYNLGHCECSRNILAEFPTSLQNTPNGTRPTHLTAVDKEGQTILHYACRKGFFEVVRDLLKAGAGQSRQHSIALCL